MAKKRGFVEIEEVDGYAILFGIFMSILAVTSFILALTSDSVYHSFLLLLFAIVFVIISMVLFSQVKNEVRVYVQEEDV